MFSDRAATKSLPKLHLCAVMLVLLLPFLLGNNKGCGTAAPSTFIAISDVHFNPFDDTTLFDRLVAAPAEDWDEIFQSSTKTALPAYGEESNFTLLSKALDSATSHDANPAVVIFPGDILCHNFKTTFDNLYGSVDQDALESFIMKTVRFFVLQVRERFIDAPVLFTLGNNDSYAGDYDLVAGGDFLAETADLFKNQWLDDWVQSSTFNQSYKAGGYYTASVSKKSIRLVSLNSVLFTTHRPAPVAGDAAYIQLDWFEEQLAAAQNSGQQVYVVTHVPPGTNIYSTIANHMDAQGRIADVDDMWHDGYQTRFLAIMEAYPNLSITFFSGHTHMDEFRLIYNDARSNTPATVLGQPAISPVFENNPAYKVFNVNIENWELQDYTAQALRLDQSSEKFSQEYKFTTQYNLSNATAPSMAALSNSLALGGEDKTSYIQYYYSGSPRSPITETNWHGYRCSTGFVRADKYKTCVNNSVP
ncbi:metallophosphoesterase [Desulfovibrio sp. JC010]|uniref:metallophosphoesterase n=1 Tax=Desulfovibrio sp. JC010 TaxID=2593641 RepID=UPI0013D0A789|nr:metallophosphoesterase [Desulfovibrio sp. JC010]NDV25900.1 hypothetical protein [Desulfovibrio sp. JC010]